MNEMIEQLLAENQRLRERLEIAYAWRIVDHKLRRVPAPEDMPDGIEARDETIRLQEERIAELEAKLARHRRFWASIKRRIGMKYVVSRARPRPRGLGGAAK